MFGGPRNGLSFLLYQVNHLVHRRNHMLMRAFFALFLVLGAAGMVTLQDDPLPGCDPCPGAQVR
jgi:hypothetical protein